jgi:hypothetical protein
MSISCKARFSKRLRFESRFLNGIGGCRFDSFNGFQTRGSIWGSMRTFGTCWTLAGGDPARYGSRVLDFGTFFEKFFPGLKRKGNVENGGHELTKKSQNAI